MLNQDREAGGAEAENGARATAASAAGFYLGTAMAALFTGRFRNVA